MSASTNIILNERFEEQQAPPPLPPSVRAVQSLASLVCLFLAMQGVVDYFVLRILCEMKDGLLGVGVEGAGTGPGAGVNGSFT